MEWDGETHLELISLNFFEVDSPRVVSRIRVIDVTGPVRSQVGMAFLTASNLIFPKWT